MVPQPSYDDIEGRYERTLDRIAHALERIAESLEHVDDIFTDVHRPDDDDTDYVGLREWATRP